jgi:DNA invertase Pin-like site-specific DNA recombinase
VTPEQALARLDEYADVPADVGRIYRRRARAIREAYAAGVSVTTIAARLKVNRRVVYRALDAAQEGFTDA